MKAFITSIGEVTTDLCEWSLKRNGFETVMVYNEISTLADKLAHIYGLADDDFVRVDADIVVNKHFTPSLVRANVQGEEWWLQFMTYDWFQQDVCYGGAQFIKREALPILRKKIEYFRYMERPETELSRIEEFYSPRRFESREVVVGLNGYKADDVGRIIRTKTRRKQMDNYDFELARKLDELS